jgi:hypothetical protein
MPMTNNSGKTPEEQLDLLSERWDKLLGYLNTAEVTHRNEEYNEWLLHKNMLKVGFRAFKNWKIIITPMIGVILAGVFGYTVWQSLGWGQKTLGIAITAAAIYMFVRRETIRYMATPQNEFFHIQAFAQNHKVMYDALSPFIRDEYFKFSKLKENLKKSSLDEKVIKSYQDRIDELLEVKNKNEEKIMELSQLLKLHIEELKHTQADISYYANRVEETSAFLDKIRNNLSSFVRYPNLQFLDSLSFDCCYIIYKLDDNEFVDKHSQGLNSRKIKAIPIDHHQDGIVKSMEDGEIYIDLERGEASQCVTLHDGSTWGIRIILDDTRREALMGSQEYAKIELSLIFEHIWLSLDLVVRFESMRTETSGICGQDENE